MTTITETRVLERKVKLIRGQRGNYGWEITVSDDDMRKVITKIKQIDMELMMKFAPEDYERMVHEMIKKVEAEERKDNEVGE